MDQTIQPYDRLLLFGDRPQGTVNAFISRERYTEIVTIQLLWKNSGTKTRLKNKKLAWLRRKKESRSPRRLQQLQRRLRHLLVRHPRLRVNLHPSSSNHRPSKEKPPLDDIVYLGTLYSENNHADIMQS
jgi:hypothetical protein